MRTASRSRPFKAKPKGEEQAKELRAKIRTSVAQQRLSKLEELLFKGTPNSN